MGVSEGNCLEAIFDIRLKIRVLRLTFKEVTFDFGLKKVF